VGSGLQIGRIRGISIKLHPSFLLALIWVVYHWGIASGEGIQGAMFGLFLLVAVFVCVVGHELAHGFLALRYGLKVHDITLLPIGGVARIEHAPLPPRREAMIALAGPILNLLVAGGLTPVVVGILLSRHAHDALSFLGIAGESGPAGLIFHLWLANVMLAIFNLLPAFPMDGGRVLRAVLSRVGNRVAATRVAVLLGQGLALLLTLAGLYVHDFVLPLVALFVVASALAESRMIQMENALRVLPVGQFALWEMGGVSPDAPLSYALRGGARDVAVIEHGVVLGMLWRETVVERARSGHGVLVRDAMDPTVTPMTVDDSVFEVHREMVQTKRPAIPIIEDGIYRGIFTSDRLVHVYQYLQSGSQRRLRYAGLAEALGLVGFGR
jgi:Zn-dependent protease